MDDAPVKIIQISDLHLNADPEGQLLGVKTEESFRAVVDLIKRSKEEMDFILLTGDLSQDASVAAYHRVADIIKTFPVPAYYIPGNHDDPKIMAQVYPRDTISSHRHLILKNWHLILLNTHKPGAVEGFLDSSQLHYLEHCLQTYPEHQAVIFLHHHVLPVGCAWLDRLGVTNADEFWKIVEHYPKVSAIFSGHVHQEFHQVKNNIPVYTLPSTCIQFKRNQDHFGLEELAPGYRYIHLYPDGHLETGIKRVEHYVGVFDKDAKGY